jgi:hypothetical protein
MTKIPNSKLIDLEKRTFVSPVWNLEFIWDLGIGIGNF